MADVYAKNFPEPFFVVNKKGVILKANNLAKKTFKLAGPIAEHHARNAFGQTSFKQVKEEIEATSSGKKKTTLLLHIPHLSKHFAIEIAPLEENFLVVCKDISECLELENVKETLDHSAMFCVRDKTGRILQVNHRYCTALKFTQRELVGTKHDWATIKKLQKSTTEKSSNEESENKIWHGQTKHIAKNGSVVWTKTTIMPRFDHEGKFYEYMEIKFPNTREQQYVDEIRSTNRALRKHEEELQKISEEQDVLLQKVDLERESIEKEVRERTRKLAIADLKIMSLLEQKNRFIGQIAHDLRTPLTPIYGSLQLLSTLIKDEKQKENIDTALLNCEYLKNLLNDILLLAQLDNATEQLNLAQEHLETVVENTIKKQKLTLEQEGVKLELQLEKTPTVPMDVLKIEEVIGNLISNALKYGKKNVKLACKVKATEEHVQFTLQDNGVGIEKKELEKIFIDFYKIDRSRHKISFGLGLPICKRIIAKHKGRIWAESAGVNKGSAFHFTIPL